MTTLNQKDIRVSIISRIWAYATVMFLISILLNSQGQDRKVLFLPAIILLGAVTSTIVVLRKLRDHQYETLFPSKKLEELKQRIENLEVIASSDDWEHALKQLAQTKIQTR